MYMWVCACVSVIVHVHVYMRVCSKIYVRWYSCMYVCMYACMYVRICMYVCVCTKVCKHVVMVCFYICCEGVYECVCVCMCVCVHLYILVCEHVSLLKYEHMCKFFSALIWVLTLLPPSIVNLVASCCPHVTTPHPLCPFLGIRSKLGGHHFRFDHTPVRGTSFLEVVAAPAAASTSGAPVEASVEGGTCQSESSDSEAEADEGDLGTERRPSSSTAVEGEEGQKVVVAEADADEGEPPFDVLWLAETLFDGLVRENLARTRFIYRCIPVQKTCRARLKHIERALDRWLPQILPQNRMSPYRVCLSLPARVVCLSISPPSFTLTLWQCLLTVPSTRFASRSTTMAPSTRRIFSH